MSVSPLFGTLRVCINGSFLTDILMVLKDLRFKSRKRIYTIDFSLFLKVKSLDMLA